MRPYKNDIILKGNQEGLTINIPKGCDIEEILNQLKLKLESAGKFFKGASLKVVYRGATLSFEDERKIVDVLENVGGAKIESFQKEDTKSCDSLNERLFSSIDGIKKIMYFKGLEEGICKFVGATVRGGSSVQFNGNVVVLGDINPGGEVIAAGNVIVMGTVRGVVHAGSDGNRKAIICALRLKPTQLRIANFIARCPDVGYEDGLSPEIAFVREGNIYVESLNQR